MVKGNEDANDMVDSEVSILLSFFSGFDPMFLNFADKLSITLAGFSFLINIFLTK